MRDEKAKSGEERIGDKVIEFLPVCFPRLSHSVSVNRDLSCVKSIVLVSLDA